MADEEAGPLRPSRWLPAWSFILTSHSLRNSHVLIRINANMGLKEMGKSRKKS